jgi:uncharacterized peroxidase-related enzyme
MQLEPIEKPRSWTTRFAYWMARRQLGAVPSVFKVFYARAPKLGMLGFRIYQTLEKGTSLDPSLRHLVLAQSSAINGCGFCADLHRAQVVREKLGVEKFDGLLDFRTSAAFSERERAALAYGEEVTRHRKVSDATFAALRQHFDEREIVEIVWLTALGNYFNLIAVPLGLESDGLTEIAMAESG